MKTLEYFARVLALLWAGFWMFFSIVESLTWHTPVHRMAMSVCVGLMFVLLALAPWRWEFPGGLMLMAAGVLAALAYAIWWPLEVPLTTRVATLLVFGLPPAVAGVLFLMHYHGLTDSDGAHG